MALTEAQLGEWGKAQESLVRALDHSTDSRLGAIDNALQATLVLVLARSQMMRFYFFKSF